MLEELSHHGYKLSPGTLYPMLHGLEEVGILTQQSKTVEGKVRKYYSSTAKGQAELEAAKLYLKELLQEIKL